YPAYAIHRERDGAVHGDWVAVREGVELHAETPTALLVRLESQELSRLQAEHGDRYSIRRTPSVWIATRRDDAGWEPTLMADSTEVLGAERANPRRRGARAPGPRREL